MPKKFVMPCAVLFLSLIFSFIPVKQENVLDRGQVPFGSYGLAFSKMPPKHKKRVIFIGNSVFYGTAVVPIVEAMAKDAGLDVEMGNFAITGSSIADYIITYNYIRQFDPDLIVIQTAPITFGYDWPLFRTDAKYLIFLPQMKRLWKKAFLTYYSHDEIVKSLVYRIFPVLRYTGVYKATLKDDINALLVRMGGIKLMDFFPFTTNEGLAWMKARNILAVSDHKPVQYPQAVELLRLLARQIDEDGTDTVIIEQESGYQKLPISRTQGELLKGYRHIDYFDFSSFYKSKNYVDVIHPDKKEAVAVAGRIFKVIQERL